MIIQFFYKIYFLSKFQYLKDFSILEKGWLLKNGSGVHYNARKIIQIKIEGEWEA
jgi:hypothetical protein